MDLSSSEEFSFSSILGSRWIFATPKKDVESDDGFGERRKRTQVRKSIKIAISAKIKLKMHFLFRFTAEEKHFPRGELRLECVAEISGVWKTHVEGVALGGTNERVRIHNGNNEPNSLLVTNDSGLKLRFSFFLLLAAALNNIIVYLN